MKAISLFLLLFAITACKSTPAPEEVPTEGIGYIGDYSKFKLDEEKDGIVKYVYVSDLIKSGKYKKVMIESLGFYPAIPKNKKLQRNVLSGVADYMRDEIKAKSPIEIVDTAGEGVLKLNIRISTVKITHSNVRVLEFIPVAAILSTAQMIAGARQKDVEIYIEVKATDGVTDEMVGGSVKFISTKRVANFARKVKFKDIKPLIDKSVERTVNVLGELKEMSSK